MSGLGITDLTDVEPTKRALLCESILLTRLTKQLELFDEGFISDRSLIDEHRYLENEYVNNFFNKEKEELRYCNKIKMVTGSVEERIAQINKAIDDLAVFSLDIILIY